MGIHNLVGLIFLHNQPSLKLFESFSFQRWDVLPGVALLDQCERDLIIVGKHLID